MAGQPTDAEIIASIPDTLPVGIWVARAPGGEFVYANAAFQQIMGMTGQEGVAAGEYAEPYGIYGTDGALYPEERMPFVQALEAGHTVVVDDIVIHRTDGRRVHVRAYAEPVHVDGTIDHVVIAFIDITREVAAERARVDSEGRMQRVQRMESVGNLAGGIAHDFNNLVGAIRVIATSLSEKHTDPETRQALAAIETATQSAQDLTTALLGFAGGKPAQAHRPLQLDLIVARVATLLDRALDPRHSVVLELGSPLPVMGDRTRLEQVVMNLALNARDAMPEGGQVLLRTEERDGLTVLSVIDEGSGIPEALRERVFEPYFTTRDRPSGRGVGLGLATVYGIVSGHDGTVTVLPTTGGAHIEVVFPGVIASLKTLAPMDDTPPGPEPRPGRRVLVVDDEPLVSQAACLALRILGHEPTPVSGGLEAVDAYEAAEGGFDAVLLDLAMPGMDGRQTTMALKQLDPNVRVILASGYALREQTGPLRALGVTTFLDKPYGMAQLKAALARALE